MSRTPDLVRDSKLETRFHTRYTCHVFFETGSTPRERAVAREEYWMKHKPIGRGAFATVWLEQCVKGQREIKMRAVKEIAKPQHLSNAIDYNRELEAIAKFSHQKYDRCFVKSYGWYEQIHTLYIAMVYLPYGDLQKYLASKSPLEESEAQAITFQILEGLAFLHENGFAHRDLKPGIGDFGISKRTEDEIVLPSAVKGTLGFMAPELHGFFPDSIGSQFGGSQEQFQAADIWSLGEIAFQILTKEPCFKNMGNLFTYVQNPHTFPFASLQANAVSDNATDFISRAMVSTPTVRLTAKVALLHAWMEPFKSPSPRPASIASIRSILQNDTSLPWDPAINEPSARWSTVSATDPQLPSLNKQDAGLAPNSTQFGAGSRSAEAATQSIGHDAETTITLNRPSPKHQPISASLPRYCFDNDMYWFVIECQMEDGRHWELSRYYADFYDFQVALLEAFPEEAGNKGKPRTLPFMPGPVAQVTDAISNGRRRSLDEYIRKILSMPPHISKCQLVGQLFLPRPGDFEINEDDESFSSGSFIDRTHHDDANSLPIKPNSVSGSRETRKTTYDQSDSGMDRLARMAAALSSNNRPAVEAIYDETIPDTLRVGFATAMPINQVFSEPSDSNKVNSDLHGEARYHMVNDDNPFDDNEEVSHEDSSSSISHHGQGAQTPHSPIRQWKTIKEVQLMQGNLVLDMPIRDDMLNKMPHAKPPARNEFTHSRYMAVTCDPKDFYNTHHTLRPRLYARPRSTELLIAVSGLGKDSISFVNTIQSIEEEVRRICSNTRFLSHCQEKNSPWKSIVLCLCNEGTVEEPKIAQVLREMGLLDDGSFYPIEVKGQSVTAYIHEYSTTFFPEWENGEIIVRSYEETHRVPIQIILCEAERSPSSEFRSLAWIRAIGAVLNARTCITVDVGWKLPKNIISKTWEENWDSRDLSETHSCLPSGEDIKIVNCEGTTNRMFSHFKALGRAAQTYLKA